ncbi:MAG: SPOR domain-containing protein [Desulfovibrionaceae bacterium]
MSATSCFPRRATAASLGRNTASRSFGHRSLSRRARSWAALLCCAAALVFGGLANATPALAQGFAVQLGTAQTDNKFSSLRQQVRDMGLPEYVIASYTDGVHFFVHAGTFASVEALLAAQAMLEEKLQLATTLVYDHTTEAVPATVLADLRDAQAKTHALATASVQAQPAPTAPAAPAAPPTGDLYSVQVSSSATLAQAQTAQAAFQAKGFDATVIMLYDGQHVPWHVVQAGAFGSYAEARALADRLAGTGVKSIIHRLAAALIRERTQTR